MTATPSPDLRDATTEVSGLRTQHAAGLVGVPGHGIRLTWTLHSERAGVEQIAYQVSRVVAGDAAIEGDIVVSSDQIGVDVGDVPSGSSASFAVRVATDAGWTSWSDAVVVEASPVLATLDAQVIGISTEVEGPVALLRREFTVGSVPESARLRLSALGVVNAWVNGVRVGDAVLTPGWTSYDTRVLVDTHDVTSLLREGANVLVLELGDGWYRGRLGWFGRDSFYGNATGAFAQIDAGDRVLVATDESWRGGFGAVRAASLYDGTVTDLALAPAGIHESGFDDEGWTPVRVLDVDRSVFEPRAAAPVRIVSELPMTPTARPTGVQLDAGQNISGWVRLVVSGHAGDVIVVTHAEVLEAGGALHTAALRTAKATDTYVLDRDGEHVLEPTFTFHGFRYAEVAGPVDVITATGIAISSDLTPRSTLTTSNDALNAFHSNVFWSQRDNFVSVPTDCPQRDERLGWTGDAQAFAATANTLMDTEAFWLNWLRDLEADQTDEGGVASVVPDILQNGGALMGGEPFDTMGRAGWADAATIVPWSVYESTGSTQVLSQQLDSMRRWVGHLRRRAGAEVLLPTEPFQYGDWLDPDAPGDRPWQAKVSSDFVANAFYVHAARVLARAERLVGDVSAADEADALADAVAAATWERWRDEGYSTQTGAALALEFGIAPESERQAVADALADNVRAENGRIATGFLGTPLVLFALSNNGHVAEAYRMALRREAPSWLYQVDRGATTVWERWDAIAPDGSIHSGTMDTGDSDDGGSMLSFNHYAYGAMIDWVYRTVAGLSPAEAGYRVTAVAPRPGVDLRSARATILTGYGELGIDWILVDDELRATLTVPVGITAHLDLPTTDASIVTVGGIAAPTDLGSGRHEIVVTAPAIAGSAANVDASLA